MLANIHFLNEIYHKYTNMKIDTWKNNTICEKKNIMPWAFIAICIFSNQSSSRQYLFHVGWINWVYCIVLSTGFTFLPRWSFSFMPSYQKQVKVSSDNSSPCRTPLDSGYSGNPIPHHRAPLFSMSDHLSQIWLWLLNCFENEKWWKKIARQSLRT